MQSDATRPSAESDVSGTRHVESVRHENEDVDQRVDSSSSQTSDSRPRYDNSAETIAGAYFTLVWFDKYIVAYTIIFKTPTIIVKKITWWRRLREINNLLLTLAQLHSLILENRVFPEQTEQTYEVNKFVLH